MADRVFGPHVSGLNFLGVHIGATTDVFRDDSGGKKVPASLSIVLTSPLGKSATISNVANGQTANVQVTPGISVTGTVNNCRTEPAAAGSPELFAFQFTLRANGSVKVGPFPVPVNVQIDAFDVHVPTDAAVHAQIQAGPPA
ncbi:MAG: hypothetical protein QOF71_193 [Candidatus Eremiobacteraeota bacterium]|jgi:hypothetical protein|nr:hypothetical protein [Candidatus Eremiobacteraeota bacterium]